jgi:hypothetical protein
VSGDGVLASICGIADATAVGEMLLFDAQGAWLSASWVGFNILVALFCWGLLLPFLPNRVAFSPKSGCFVFICWVIHYGSQM